MIHDLRIHWTIGAPVPVIPFLAKLLDEYRSSLGNPETGSIFEAPAFTVLSISMGSPKTTSNRSSASTASKSRAKS